MGDNPAFVLDEPHAHSNGLALASSDAAESVFHDPSSSLAVSPVLPRKEHLDPSGARAELVSIRSMKDGHVVIQMGKEDRPASLGTGSIKHEETFTVQQMRKEDRPASLGPGSIKHEETSTVQQMGKEDRPASLSTGSIKHEETSVNPSSSSGGTKGSPESSNLGASAGTTTATSKVASTGTKKGTKNRMKSRQRESIISQATNDDNPAVGKEQGDEKRKNAPEDVETPTAVDEGDPPWYVAMSEVYKQIGKGDRRSSLFTRTLKHDESNAESSSLPGGKKSRPESSNLSTSAGTSTATSKVTSTGTKKSTNTGTNKAAKSRRRESIVSQATNDDNPAVGKEQGDEKGKNATEEDVKTPTAVDEGDPPWYVAMSEVYKSDRRASVLSETTQTASEDYEVEDEEEEWDEDSGEDDDELYDEDDEESELANMLYTIDDNPPWYLSMGLGFQHYLTMVGSTITIPFILTPELCIQQDDPARGFILSTIFFVSGIVTFLQVTFGVRLPIVQGGSFAFFAPTLVILHTGFPACTSLALNDLTTFQRQEEWQSRMREIQGAIIAAALIEMLIGFSGLMGLVVSLITPLAIAPTVCLVGLSLFDVAAKKAASHWGISCLTILLMILFSQYMRNVKVPIPVYREKKGFSIVAANIFGLFPVLLSILLSWALCAILTATDSLPEGSAARTDTAGRLLADSPWIRVPYPGQWGWPTVSAASVLGILAALLASIVESVGDYYACARLAGAPPPPHHAINRGIGVEGMGCLIAGFWGTGNGTTSYSENIGAIGITKVGSRRVIQYGAGIMIVCGVLGKFAAAFVTIPEPVVGGIFCVMFAMITAVGLSSLAHVDLRSSRNLFVLGFPIFFGLALPKWLENNPGIIQSVRYPVMAQVVTVLLKTSMFVGGLLGIILDNTVPGTDKERGINLRRPADCEDPSGVYDFPVGMAFIRRFHWLSKVPFSPTYTGWHFKKKE